ncbi:MAG: hypothetical protein H8E94_07245 [Alphaproteobacteria bacterium]|nr:hypothetical protein [Alphaproteobacteria bacterium]
MVRTFYGLLAAAILITVLGSTPGHAQVTAACGERGSIASKLDDGYSEKPIAMGLSANGSIVEVFAAASGTFTIILTQPDGVSCILMTGENWEGSAAMKAGLET